jgi:hypothetical protein
MSTVRNDRRAVTARFACSNKQLPAQRAETLIEEGRASKDCECYAERGWRTELSFTGSMFSSPRLKAEQKYSATRTV